MWTLGPIRDAAAATKALNEAAGVWYVVAAVQAVFLGYLYYTGAESASVFGDVVMCVLAGYFLPRRRSRVFALCLLCYSLVVLSLTAATKLGLYAGTGKNIIVAMILVWTAVRGVQATRTYHARLGSQVIWRHCIIVGVIVAISLVVVVIGVFITLVMLERDIDLMTDDELGAWLLIPLIIVWSVAFIILPLKFPFIRIPEKIAAH